MKKKTQQKTIAGAWGAFFASQRIEDPKILHASGWRLPVDIAKDLCTHQNAARQLCMREAENGTLDSKKFKIKTKTGTKTVVFYRPKNYA